MQKLNLIEELKKLGLVDAREEQTLHSDEFVVLQICLSKLSSRVDVDRILKNVTSVKNIDVNELGKLQKIYEQLVLKKKEELGTIEKLGVCRSFEENENKLMLRIKGYKNKEQNYIALQELLNNEESLREFATKANTNIQDLRKALETNYNDIKSDFLKSKVLCLNSAVDHLVWLGARTVNFSDEIKR